MMANQRVIIAKGINQFIRNKKSDFKPYKI